MWRTHTRVTNASRHGIFEVWCILFHTHASQNISTVCNSVTLRAVLLFRDRSVFFCPPIGLQVATMMAMIFHIKYVRCLFPSHQNRFVPTRRNSLWKSIVRGPATVIVGRCWCPGHFYLGAAAYTATSPWPRGAYELLPPPNQKQENGWGLLCTKRIKNTRTLLRGTIVNRTKYCLLIVKMVKYIYLVGFLCIPYQVPGSNYGPPK